MSPLPSVIRSYLHVPRDVPELLGDGVPRLGHVPLHQDLVLPLQLLEDERSHDAVAHDQREEADVREEKAAEINVKCRRICSRLN